MRVPNVDGHDRRLRPCAIQDDFAGGLPSSVPGVLLASHSDITSDAPTPLEESLIRVGDCDRSYVTRKYQDDSGTTAFDMADKSISPQRLGDLAPNGSYTVPPEVLGYGRHVEPPQLERFSSSSDDSRHCEPLLGFADAL